MRKVVPHLQPAFIVTVNSAPLATITPSGPLTFPQGGNVILNATTGTGYTYQWKKDGVIINGASLPAIQQQSAEAIR